MLTSPKMKTSEKWMMMEKRPITNYQLPLYMEL